MGPVIVPERMSATSDTRHDHGAASPGLRRPLGSNVRLGSSTLGRLALAVLIVAVAAFLYYQTRGTTLLADEWKWALYRRSNAIGTFLSPHNEHFSLVPLVIYRLLFATVGIRDYGPYRAMVIAGHLTCVVLVYVYAVRRVGSFLALCAAALILFLGPGWQNMMWPFQIAWLISLAAGIGALLLLDRRDRIGDIAACLLTGVSLASSGVGIAIALGVAVDLAVARRRWRDAWIVALPLLLFGLWWLRYQQATPASPIHTIPGFVADSAASALSALVGLAGNVVTAQQSGTLLRWGRPLEIIALIALVWRLVALRRVPPRALTLLTMVLSFWVIIGLGRGLLGATSVFPSRYIYIGGVLIVLLAVELARDVRVRWPVGAIVGCVVAAAAVVNVGILRDAGASLRRIAQFTRADLGALDISRGIVAPSFRADLSVFFGSVVAGPYFAAERAYGTPADSPAELAHEPEDARRAADAELIAIHRIELRPSSTVSGGGVAPAAYSITGGRASKRGACVTFGVVPAGGGHAALEVAVPPQQGLLIRAQASPAKVAVRRFADEFQPVGVVPSRSSSALRIGPDLAAQPWQLRVVTNTDAAVCGLGAGHGDQ